MKTDKELKEIKRKLRIISNEIGMLDNQSHKLENQARGLIGPLDDDEMEKLGKLPHHIDRRIYVQHV